MLNQIMLKNSYSVIFIYLFIFPIICQNFYAQEYPDMKLILKNGVTIDGDDGTMSDSSVTLKVGGMQKTYPLSDVQLVMVKKGLGGKYALYAGGGCAALVLITTIAYTSSDDYTGEEKYATSTLILGGVIWVGIFAVGGYLIGNGADDWNTIYTAPAQSSILERFKFGFAGTRRGEFRFGISYQF